MGAEDIINDVENIVFYARTTVISKEMFNPRQRSSLADLSQQLTTHESVIPKSTVCQVYKYAPRHGYADVHNDVLIFFTDKIQENRYGGKMKIFSVIN